jgi:ribonuclease P protein component
MLKKSFRLRKNEDFSRVFRQGTPLFFGAIGCKIVKNNENHLRVGFSFSKKHLRTAVSRNRLRRVIIAHFQETGSTILRSPQDVVFFTVRQPEHNGLQPFASWVQSVVEYIGSK